MSSTPFCRPSVAGPCVAGLRSTQASKEPIGGEGVLDRDSSAWPGIFPADVSNARNFVRREDRLPSTGLLSSAPSWTSRARTRQEATRPRSSRLRSESRRDRRPSRNGVAAGVVARSDAIAVAGIATLAGENCRVIVSLVTLHFWRRRTRPRLLRATAVPPDPAARTAFAGNGPARPEVKFLDRVRAPTEDLLRRATRAPTMCPLVLQTATAAAPQDRLSVASGVTRFAVKRNAVTLKSQVSRLLLHRCFHRCVCIFFLQVSADFASCLVPIFLTRCFFKI